MDKKICSTFAILLCFAILLFYFFSDPLKVYAEDPYFSGEGTEITPFQISTPEQLSQLAVLVNLGDVNYNSKFYELTCDLDLSALTGWVPVGTGESTPFSGSFDGNNNTISHLALSGTVDAVEPAACFGLFGYLAGVVKNVGMVQSSMTLSGTGTGYSGGITGYNTGSVQNCYYDGVIISTLNFGGTGGIAGYNSGTINGCYHEGDLTSLTAGGIAGENTGSIHCCYNTGNITGSTFSGGICAKNQLNLDSSWNTGLLSGAGICGGICGENNDGTGVVDACYYLNTIPQGIGNGTGSTISCNLDEMQTQSTYSLLNFDTDWLMPAFPHTPILRALYIPLTAITLSDQSMIPEEAMYVLTLTPQNASLPDVSWTNSDPSVASVNEEGFVTALSVGTTVLTATSKQDNAILDSCTITVHFSSYTVVFKDWDGTNLKTQSVEYGAGATAPASPTRTGYTFAGWDTAFGNITSDLTVTALYNINSYTVTFKDWDGTTLNTQSVEYGAGATAPAAPARTGYTFAGWDTVFDNITSDLTVTALYNINSYTVTFKDWDGTTLKTQSVEYGAGATAPASPARTGYTFAGWNVDFSSITSDLTVTALYNINSYTVTFKDWDGTTLKTQSVEYGGGATAPAAPTRTGYTFAGWDTAFDNVTSDLTVTALYTINSYTITFKDWDGTPLKTQSVEYGGSATAPAAPTRTGYTFAGWDTAFGNITSDLTVTALYNINSYTVTFKDWDGTTLKTQSVEYGAGATAPASPTRTGYTFAGWDTAFDNVTSDLTVTALYTINSYTVTFKDWDGTSLKTQFVEYGAGATAPASPTRTGYTFAGWDTDFGNITSDLTVNALYTINSYTVTFKDWDGTSIKTQSVEYGGSATAPAAPARTGYTFAGWDTSFSLITANKTVIAQYTINSYTVTFNSQGGSEVANKTANYNTLITVPATPTRYNYNFIGWYKESACTNAWNFSSDKVTANTALYAKWVSSVPDSVTSVTYFVNNNSGTISKIAVGTTINMLKGGMNEKNYLKFFNGTLEVTGNTLAGTGNWLKIMDGNTVKRSYALIVTGDINGDGKITLTDFIRLKSHILAQTALTGVYASAADINGDGKITLTDYVKTKSHLLDQELIKPVTY